MLLPPKLLVEYNAHSYTVMYKMLFTTKSYLHVYQIFFFCGKFENGKLRLENHHHHEAKTLCKLCSNSMFIHQTPRVFLDGISILVSFRSYLW